MGSTEGRRQRGLTREAIVARALEIGEAEGLEAVTLRRLASECAVTPMALYRHVRDKQDLVNAMAEAVLDDFDVTVGFRPSMSWTERIRQVMLAYKEEMDRRPLALQLGIAYSGEGPPGFWRMLETLLEILLGAGFERRQALVLIRVITNLLAGYVFLLRQDAAADLPTLDPRALDLVRQQVERSQLSLPPDEFPNLVAGAGDTADIWISDPDRWWRDTVDLLVLGLEALLARSGAGTPPPRA